MIQGSFCVTSSLIGWAHTRNGPCDSWNLGTQAENAACYLWFVAREVLECTWAFCVAWPSIGADKVRGTWFTYVGLDPDEEASIHTQDQAL